MTRGNLLLFCYCHDSDHMRNEKALKNFIDNHFFLNNTILQFLSLSLTLMREVNLDTQSSEPSLCVQVRISCESQGLISLLAHPLVKYCQFNWCITSKPFKFRFRLRSQIPFPISDLLHLPTTPFTDAYQHYYSSARAKAYASCATPSPGKSRPEK